MLFTILVIVLVVWGIALFAGYRTPAGSPGPWATAGDFLAWIACVLLTLLHHGVHF